MSKTATVKQMNQVRAVIKAHLELGKDFQIAATDTLKSLKIGTVDRDTIVMDLEEEFDIEIPGGAAFGWKTVGDIDTYIANYNFGGERVGAYAVQQPKKVVVQKKKAGAVSEPARFENSRPHNLSLIMGDLEKKLAPTKATAGFVMQVSHSGAIHLCNVPLSTTFARAVVEISEGFNGFRLYVGEMLVIEHNVGAESHILQLCKMAHAAGAQMPKSLDEWLVSVIVRYVVCVKKSLRYMQHLFNGKDTTQQLFSLQDAFELKISDRVFDFYEHENVVEFKADDVRRVFDEMLTSAYKREGNCYMTGSSFIESEEEEEDDGEEQDDFSAEPIDAGEIDENVDTLNAISTLGLIELYNAVVFDGRHDLEDSEAHLLQGMSRRNAIIQELSAALSPDEIQGYLAGLDGKFANALAGR